MLIINCTPRRVLGAKKVPINQLKKFVSLYLMQKVFFDCYEDELQAVDRAHFVLLLSFMIGL